MSNLADTPPVPSNPSPIETSAREILAKFLDEKGIELRLTPPMVRQVDGGGVIVEQPQIVVNYRMPIPPTNSISSNKN
jgi:hypothetical protein